MAFIGNSVQNQGFAPAVDYFNGDGTTVTFTLSRPVASVAQLTAVIENVIQNPATAFTVAGNQLTFTSAPPAGTNNIWVEYTSLITQYNGISQDPSVVGDITASGGYLATGDFGNSYIDGTIVDYVTGTARLTTGPSDDMTFYHGGTASRSEMMTLYHAGGAKIFGNTALTIPVGTTAQRPGTPAVGMTRYNTTLNQFEFYQNGNWTQYSTVYEIQYLVVAGGGGAGGRVGGGGGAGGYVSTSTTVISTTAYSLVVGAGGTGGFGGIDGTEAPGTQGSNSSAFSTTSIGGGFGRDGNTGSGGSGGSGGGSGYGGSPGSGTSGQGNNGGNSGGNTGTYQYKQGGGGGASAVGGDGNTTTGKCGDGGAGSTWLNGSTYAGGGGGGSHNPINTGLSQNGRGLGGAGGGGNAGTPGGKNAGDNGTANTGGGGGGASTDNANSYKGGNGGSGVVIIRYAGSQRGSGGTVTSAGGYTYHTFTTSGTFTA